MQLFLENLFNIETWQVLFTQKTKRCHYAYQLLVQM